MRAIFYGEDSKHFMRTTFFATFATFYAYIRYIAPKTKVVKNCENLCYCHETFTESSFPLQNSVKIKTLRISIGFIVFLLFKHNRTIEY